MPLYDYRCPLCGTVKTAFNRIDDRHAAPRCGCQAVMQLCISAPAVHTDLPCYQSPIDGRWIEGKAARREDLKRHGCRPWEGLQAEQQHAASAKASDDAAFERTLERATWDTLNQMSAEKQKVLKTAM